MHYSQNQRLVADPPVTDGPPHAVTRPSRRFSIIWIVPLVALAIGAWLAWDTLSKEGPTIEISFETAEGLQAGQSQLRYKDIVFGTVKGLVLSDDRTHVVVTVATTRQAEPLLAEGTVFWVVKPRLFAGSISGLETLISGSYIGMLPAQTPGKSKGKFAGQEDPPILPVNVPGRVFQLKSPRIGSISLGSPIFYRDLSVGEVLGWDIADMAESVTIHAFVRAPYDRYVNDQTRFWNASGLSLKLGATGIDVQVESLKALVLGGVAFETPAAETHTAAVAQDQVFPLFDNRDDANSASYTRVMSVISYFADSVSGLGPGSDVRMRGFKVGQVTDVRLSADPQKGTIVAAVRYKVQPERIVGIGKRLFKTDAEAVGALLGRGLRAGLESASLITGQQVVALEFVADAPPVAAAMEGSDFVLPTTEGGGFGGLASSATDVLNKVNAIPFAQIGTSLNGILRSVNDATQGPDLKRAVADLASTLAATQDLVRKFDAGATPAAKQLPEIAATLQKALANVNKLAVSVEGGYGDDTKFHRDLDRLLGQTDESVRSLRALADLLARHPEALIKGRPE
jgi:paraquat-inducible protein B